MNVFPTSSHGASAACIERLESRIAPAAFVVINFRDSGLGSLRDAIDHANASPGADTITFAPAVRGVIVLKSALPAITNDLTITGPASGLLAIDGARQFNIFTVTDGLLDDGVTPKPVDVTIAKLTLTHGHGRAGGALEIDDFGGHVTLQASVLTGNVALGLADEVNYIPGDARGGAVALFAGTLTIDRSVITANVARAVDNGATLGGGIFAASETTLEIRSSRISGNSAFGSAGVAGIAGEAGESAGEILDAGAKGQAGGDGTAGYDGGDGGRGLGGGIASFGTLTIETSTISGNLAMGGTGGQGGRGGAGGAGGRGGYGGGDTGYAPGFGGNGGDGGAGGAGGNGGSGEGGGIHATGAITIRNSTISGNLARPGAPGLAGAGGAAGAAGPVGFKVPPSDPGGGFFGSGLVVRTNSTTFAITTVGTATITNVPPAPSIVAAVDDPGDTGPAKAGVRGIAGAPGSIGTALGGGIQIFADALDTSDAEHVTLSQVTIALNRAITSGGGIHHDGLIPTDIKNSTIATNVAGTGGGIFTEATGAGSPVHLISTIVARNLALTAPLAHDVSGSIDASFSLIQFTAGAEIAGSNNRLSVAPRLGDLQNNGGPTFTMLPASTSPAINAGSNPDTLTADQRGRARPLGGLPDIGAIEVR